MEDQIELLEFKQAFINTNILKSCYKVFLDGELVLFTNVVLW